MVLSWRSPSPPLSKFLNRCLQECHTKMDPEALQRSGSSPRTHNPRAEREHRGPKRHHRRRLESDGRGRRSDPAQEGQTEDVVEPWRRGKSGANQRRRTASRPVTASQNSEKNGKRLVGRNSTAYPVENQPLPISPPLYARGKRFACWNKKRAEKGRWEAPPQPNGRSP